MERMFSLAQLTVPKCPVPEMVYIAGMTGYGYISPQLTDLIARPELVEQTKKAMEYTGVGIHDIRLNIYQYITDVRNFEPVLALGALLGAKYMHSGIWADESDYFAPIERFGELCDLASDYDMGVRLEFVAWSSVRDLSAAQQAIQYVNRPNAGYIVDMFHAHCSCLLPGDLQCVWEGCLDFVHLCDAPKEIPPGMEETIRIGRCAREYLGEGGIDVAAYMRYVPRGAVCCIEIPNLAKAAELGYAEHARRALVSAKKYLSEHNV